MQIKTIKDYYESIQNKFPGVPKKDIERIFNHGMKSFYLHNSSGGDTVISDRDFWCYCGTLGYNSFRHFNYYVNKLTVKLRLTFKKKRLDWDGYYYARRFRDHE